MRIIGKKFTVRYIFAVRNVISVTGVNFSNSTGKMSGEHKSEGVLFEEMGVKEPLKQFKIWYDDACATPGISEPRAMCLATCTRSGIPSARFVILRGYNNDGFKFFTHYHSRKGEELNENPNAALVFYWEPLRRSVSDDSICLTEKVNFDMPLINIRIEGSVEKLSEEESIGFFNSRPKPNQIEVAFSKQSQPISNRSSLSENERKFKEHYSNCDSIPKPKDWGGFIVKPHAVEFWQGQGDRLHDRIRFRIPKKDDIVDNFILHQGENGWIYERLQP